MISKNQYNWLEYYFPVLWADPNYDPHVDQAIEGKWLDMETIKTKKSGYELIKIPCGTFMMGSPKNEKGRVHYEGPRHKVTVPDFYMGKYLVTHK